MKLTTHQHSERKERIGSGERDPVLVVLLNCVGEVFFGLACCILKVGANETIDDCDTKQESLVRVSRAIT